MLAAPELGQLENVPIGVSCLDRADPVYNSAVSALLSLWVLAGLQQQEPCRVPMSFFMFVVELGITVNV